MVFTEKDFRQIQRWLALNSIRDTEFPEASIPISGTDIVALVQGGRNVRTSVANLLAGIDKEQHIALSASEYARLAKENKLDDKVMYGIIEGQRIKTLYLGKLPYVPNDDVYVINIEPQAWNLSAEVSATQITSAETRITLGGSATRIEVYTFSDGSISSTEVTGVVRWSTNVGSISNNTLIIPQTASERTIKVTASIGEGSDKVVKEFTIKQSAPASISISPSTAEVGSKGGAVDIAYTVNGNVGEIKVSNDVHDGSVVITKNGNNTSGTITFDIPALSDGYESEEPLVRTFTIYGEYGGEAKVTISQVRSGSLYVTDKSLEENVKEFSVVVNRKDDNSAITVYNIICSEDNSISVVSTSKNNNVFSFVLPENDSNVTRHWYIVFKSENGNTATCVVTQPVAITRSIKFASGDVATAGSIGVDGGEYEAQILLTNLGDGVPVVQSSSYDRNIIESASIIASNGFYFLKYKVKQNTAYVSRQTPIVVEISYGGKKYTAALAVKQAEAVNLGYSIYNGTSAQDPDDVPFTSAIVKGGTLTAITDNDLPKTLNSNTSAKCKWYAVPSSLNFTVENDMGSSEVWDTQSVNVEGKPYTVYYTYSPLTSGTKYTITINS